MNKVKKACLLLIAALLITGVASYVTVPQITAASSVSQLHVDSQYLKNSKNKKVQLKGISTHGIAWYPEYINDKCFKQLHKWGANVVRLAMYSSEYNGYCTGDAANKKALKKRIEKGVKLAKKYNMYVIIVGTPNWSQELDKAVAKPLKYKNIMYALHFYAATHGDYLRDVLKDAVSHKLPVFVTEFSICDASGSGAIDKSSASKWMKLLNKNKISYCQWNLSNKDETSSIIKSSCTKTSGFKTADLSETGKWWKNNLNKKVSLTDTGNSYLLKRRCL